MSINLTDGQIVRLFELANKVAAIRKEVPVPPSTFGQKDTVKLETAKALRNSLDESNDVLTELGALLR